MSIHHNTAILFVTHIFNEEIKKQIDKLEKEAGDFATVYVVYQADRVELELPESINRHACPVGFLPQAYRI